MRAIALAATAAIATAGTVLAVSVLPADAATTPGIDVSHHQGTINWTSVKSAGIQFAYIKATEGTSYLDPKFDTNYIGATKANVIRGAYHFALPNRSSGATQADFVYKNGGAWSADNRTLPAAVDLEYNPYGATCYGLTQSQMRSWISDFLNRYHSRTGRYAVIYTTTHWWKTCTGNYSGFASKHPLWIARYASSVGTLPSGSSFYSFWQYTASGSVSGISGSVDRNYWNGTRTRLLALANNTA
ncbi:MAG: lysozyme [Dactylosporangium sp.]|nr:lysozyme [Dactylosporangium sp.]NNJ63576.1 lysozyme [Dactylosporangium sp.]